MPTFPDPDSRPGVFSDAELECLFDEHQVNDAGRALVREVRSSPPSRSVRSGRGHVTGAYPSRKMGCTHQYESLVELSYLMECEYSSDRFEWFDQPRALSIRYLGKSDHPVVKPHTTDFLQISDEFLGYIECKPDQTLSKFVCERPGRWSRDSDGTWRSIPSEQAAARYGLGYRIRPSSSFCRVLLDNLAFLADYRSPACPPVREDAARQICDVVARRIGLTLEDLIHATAAPEAIYRMIATGELHVDLTRHFLSQPHLVLIFVDAQSSRIWDAAHACEVGGREAFDPRAPIDDLPALALHAAGEQDREVALRRYEAIRPAIDGTGVLRPCKRAQLRTLQEWLSSWRRGETEHGRGFIELLPKIHRRGNRVPRLAPELYVLMDKVAEEVYEKSAKPPRTVAYTALEERCASGGFVAPSYRIFVKWLEDRPRRRQKARREGHRAAVADAPAIPASGDGFAGHGQRPFDRIHLDHTQADLFLSLGGFVFTRIERVWLTIAHCEWSCMPVGYATSFDPPSYVSCMMVLRDVVRRHERLPRVVVVDGAGEFRSIAFDQLLAAHGVEKRQRPPGEPRHGARCERFFGTANTQFIHALAGNTQHLRDPRGMSSEVDPRRDVLWTLPELDRCLEEYLFRIYPAQPQPGLQGTPYERFTQGLELTGQRLHCKVPYDQKFFLQSLPPSRRGFATVDRKKGVTVEGIRFHAEALRDLKGKEVNVRVDPEDAGHLYVHARPAESWIECRSQHYRTFHGCSRRLVRLASEALRGGRLRGKKTPRVTAAALVPFLTGVREYEALERQRLRDAARRSSSPPAAPTDRSAIVAFPDVGAARVQSVEGVAPPDEALLSWSDLPAPTEAA